MRKLCVLFALVVAFLFATASDAAAFFPGRGFNAGFNRGFNQGAAIAANRVRFNPFFGGVIIGNGLSIRTSITSNGVFFNGVGGANVSQPIVDPFTGRIVGFVDAFGNVQLR